MHVEQFLSDLIESRMEKVEMSFIAKIVSFDKVKMRATIKPMLFSEFATGTGKPADISNAPDIKNVPVELLFANDFYIRPDYAKGDMVHVTCYASSIQQPVDSNIRTNSQKLRFQLNYCTVTSAVLPKDAVPPAEWAAKAGLLIGSTAAHMQFTPSQINIQGMAQLTGILNVIGTLFVNGVDILTTLTALQGTVAANMATYNAHTHAVVSGAGAPGSTGGPL